MGMESMFELGVVIKAVDYFTGPLRSMVSSISAADSKFKSITNTMKMMGKSKADIDGINSALQRMGDQKAFANIASDLQKVGMARQDIAEMEQSYMRMAQYQRDMATAQDKMAKGKELVASGTGDLMTSAVGAFGIVELIKQAADFQTKMTTIQNATGASTKQITDLGYAIQNTSSQVSKFTDYDVAGFAQQLATGGFNKTSQIKSLLLPVSQFAEVQQYEGKSSDATTSVNQAIELAHTFGNYDPKSFGKFLDTFNKYSMMQPGDSSTLYNTLNYLEPVAKTMGMNSDSTMALSAIANRVGLTGTHGGTNAADMIMRLIPGLVGGSPTKKGTPKAWKAMEDLGFIDKNGNSTFFDKKGKVVNANQLLSTMIADSKKYNPEQLTQKYKDIFGLQGFKAAALLGNPKAYEQLTTMQKQLGKTPSMQQETQKYLKTPEGQMSLMKSNGLILMQRVGQQLAYTLNPAIASANKLLDTMLKFTQAHPGVVKIIGDFALMAVGGKAVEGSLKIAFGALKMLDGGFGMLKVASKAKELTNLGKVIGGLKGSFDTVSMGVRLFASSFGTNFMKAFTFVKEGAQLFGSITVTMLKDFGKWIAEGAMWAAETAADWLIAMGPVGWIIAGVTALIAAGIIMWKTNFFGFRDALKGVWKTVSTDAGQAWNWIKQQAGNFMNFLKGLPGQALSIGKNIIDGLKKGLSGAIGGLLGTIKGIGNSISQTFKSIMKINSPSKVFVAHGASIIEGLTMGIDRNAHLAKKSTVNLANGVKNSFNPNVQTGSRQPIATGNTGGIINIQPGAIVIQGGNDSKEEIAQEVLRQLGKLTRGNMMNSGISVNMGAF